MGQSDDVEDSTYSRHQDLCQKLNMDATAASEAWKSYETIRQNYTLEGDQLHWIGCALYVACRKSSTPTVGRTGPNVEGNCVSLTRLLHLCNLSLIQFFTKSKNWADMANMPQDFRSKIDKLERNFTVSMLIFKKYQPIFTDIFKNPADDVARPSRSRRQRAMPCTPSRVFEFCWTLFVCIKGAFPDISHDLVNLNHLLLACCDLIYSNALLANRRDLLNPKFAGLPANYNNDDYVPPETANCIISLLCETREGIAVEAKVIKEYYLKDHINKLFNDKVLRGDQSNFSGILEPLNFDGNSKAVNKAYEQHVLSVGDFDERKFLAEWRRVRLNRISANEMLSRDITFRGKIPRHYKLKDADASDNIGSPTLINNAGDFHEKFTLKHEQYGGQMQHLAPPTPLTGRKYLRSKDVANVTLLSTATQGVCRLQALLAGRKPAPSDTLKEILNSCTQDTEATIEARVNEIGEQFYRNYTQNTEDSDTTNVDFGRKRLQLAQTLFYKLLETILSDEKRKNPNFDIMNLVSQEIFHQCLFACCLEIVIYSYKSHRSFPWILTAVNVEPYYFYKVIEIIVRSEDQLSRDIVKHLNVIEEKILETLAWKSESPLWVAIENTKGGVPSYEEVSLPGTLHLDTVDPNTPGQPVLRRLALDRGNHHDVQQSPISSASERFQSPVAVTGLAKKRLFSEGRLSGQQSVLRVGSGQSVLQSKLSSVEGDQKLQLAPNQITVLKTACPIGTNTPLQQISVNKESAKARRMGSVALFFRKFYHLAWVRMNDLCTKLELIDTDLKKKIWTIFEYSVKDQTELMKDRHLDQILMCAVYVICKIAKLDRNSFTEIMRCYRLQPQAESHIYRSVLIAKVGANYMNDRELEICDDNMDENNGDAPPTPTCMAGTSQNFGTQIRGDLIKFYNTVYVPQVKEFANKFTSRGGSTNLTLSPLPKSKSTIQSPVRRVTNSVMTRTLDPKAITASPAPQLSYCFSRSPAKDLEAINRMMISVDARKSVGKRLLADDTTVDMNAAEQSPAKKTTTPFVARKLENIIGERRTQSQ
ncbi:retinoblastoma-like protein 1 isoform X1 [Neodiprion pinetum]|uniref:Retinoblastoma-like protein 1 isoform X1 n=1 Tax=Neodiprion lecontei TaxID=441921 RepID=A0ABM3GCZ5_NEOLC|nr:retinoblastoma-like protein 1 isoform X1 [Neodiprion pinetum]XP_046598152.1 retinoblastoma-like protein 1 isoform X1 [Neodiprion lecontei]